jgi:hypothetical protein
MAQLMEREERRHPAGDRSTLCQRASEEVVPGSSSTVYLSSLPAVSPVFGLTKCSRPHAWQITPSYLSSSSDSSSSTQPCTRKPVFGQR